MRSSRTDDLLLAGPLQIRLSDSLVLAEGRPLNLSVREFRVLCAIARRAHRIVSRAELHEAVWDAPVRDGDRSVDVYVHRLRAKLEAALPDWRFIHTHVGFGYRFCCEPSHAFHMEATGR